jgi:hypothetical protein
LTNLALEVRFWICLPAHRMRRESLLSATARETRLLLYVQLLRVAGFSIHNPRFSEVSDAYRGDIDEHYLANTATVSRKDSNHCCVTCLLTYNSWLRSVRQSCIVRIILLYFSEVFDQ